MISLYNVWAVARIEIKTLFRSWFFRVLSIMSIVFLGFMNFGLLSEVGWGPWAVRAIPATIPYITILILNSVQAVIAIFLASDFLKRDRKLDTTEVVYMRSMTNGEYVAGKTAGILTVFAILNIAVLAVTAVFNIFAAKVPVDLLSYLLYPLVISLSTLVFILGLSFLFMVLIRNQAVTFIVLLGYIGTTLFYLARKFHSLFDYMAFTLPLERSTFCGFGDLPSLLEHRGIYLLLGLSFICMTVVMIKRLPQSRGITSSAKVLSVVFLAAALLLGYRYIGDILGGRSLRARIIEANNQVVGGERITPLTCDISIEHRGRTIAATARYRVMNDSSSPAARYIFTLNPGLAVDGVSGAGGPVPYRRDIHLLVIEPSVPLAPGAVDSFDVAYHGRIDEEACYPDIDEETREKPFSMPRANIPKVKKRYAFIQPDFLLLTPESDWYPVAGAGFSSERPEIHAQHFTRFTLDVTLPAGLTAVSQGKITSGGGGRFVFEHEMPLPSLSLAAADYERISIPVDSVEYAIYYKKGHDFFSGYFSEIGDTLSPLIGEALQDYENTLGLTYPYTRLTLVEVPINFFSYRHLWSVGQESVQPEIVLLPEMGASLGGVDFRIMQKRMKRRTDRTNEEISPLENECNMLNDFIGSTLTQDFGRTSFREEDPFAFTTSYNVFPNFYTFIHHIESERWPVLNMALESFWAGRLDNPPSVFRRYFTGMTPEERGNLALTQENLSEILSDPEKRNMANFVLKMKGDFLFRLLENRVGPERFGSFMENWLKETMFRATTGEAFVSGLEKDFGFDFAPYIESWYSDRKLPGFLDGEYRNYKVLDKDRERYQVRFKISNPEDVDGLVKLTFTRQRGMRGGRFRGPFGGPREEDNLERLVYFAAGETKEIGAVLDYQPGSVEINTLVSMNIPSNISRTFEEFELEKRAVPFDGERVLDAPVRLIEPGETVTDDEDPGFTFAKGSPKSLLKRMIPSLVPKPDINDRYVGWTSTGTWLATTDSKFYGRYIRSAHFTSHGDGKRKAAWTAELAESGNYDIYFHVGKVRSPFRGRRDRDSDLGSNTLFIHHDDGIEETVLDLNTAEDGWNFIGSFYISKGTAKVEINNKSKARYVVADAIKWVKR